MLIKIRKLICYFDCHLSYLSLEIFQPKTICIMPMFHAFINVSVLPTLRGGGQVIILPKFDPKEFARALIEYKVE